MQLFTLGIPCIYSALKQAFAGPEVSERKWLPDWEDQTVICEKRCLVQNIQENGTDGLIATPAGLDDNLPGFGPFGTFSHHCFDKDFPAYKRIAALIGCRQNFPVLRYGANICVTISFLVAIRDIGGGQIIAWSRFLMMKGSSVHSQPSWDRK